MRYFKRGRTLEVEVMNLKADCTGRNAFKFIMGYFLVIRGTEILREVFFYTQPTFLRV